MVGVFSWARYPCFMRQSWECGGGLASAFLMGQRMSEPVARARELFDAWLKVQGAIFCTGATRFADAHSCELLVTSDRKLKPLREGPK